MEFIHSARSFLSKHYPRNHLMLASMLSLALAITLVFAPEESAHGARVTAALPLDQPFSPTAEILNTAPAITSDYNEQTTSSVWTNVEVQAGDSLSAIFTEVGLTAQDMYKVLNSNEEAKVLNRLYPGYQLDFHIPEAGKLSQLKVLKSPLEGYVFTLKDDSYQVESIQRTADLVPSFKKGVITDSLFMAGQRAEIPAVSIMEMADIFGGVIDFILDPREGDSFSILYEEKYLDGEFIGNGEIIAAQFVNRGKEFTAVRYVNEEGDIGYYSPEGESMQKAFLRNPLDVFRISSNFNLSRKHPILNTIRAHRGTDYAAPTGTPVRATSDGVVTTASRSGSFGKLVVIQHNGQFETKYAHLNDYGQGIKKGSKVRQGQVIGYVGTTGSSTGPHLHYEFVVNGIHKDPSTVLDQLPKSVAIAPTELPRFREQIRTLVAQFEGHNEGNRFLTYNQPTNSEKQSLVE